MKEILIAAGRIVVLIMLLSACSEAMPETPTPLPEPPTPLATAVTAPPVGGPTSAPTSTAAAVPAPAEVAAPTVTPTPGLPPESTAPSGTFVSYEGISFFVPAELASNVSGTTVETTAGSAEGPWWDNYPAYDSLALEGYPLPGAAQVDIFPAQATASLNVYAGDQIEQLATVLTARPETLADADALPFLPLANAAQILHVQGEFLPSEGGDGLRYVTYYSQAFSPINNDGLFYTYQGLTSDGRYYVSVRLPVRTDALPDDATISQAEYDSLLENFDSYMSETKATLNDLGGDAFIPSLATLDALVSGIAITRSPEEPVRNNEGEPVLTILYPVDGGQMRVGESYEVSGYANPTSAPELNLELAAGPNPLVTTVVPVDPATGRWETSLTVPPNVIGPATLDVAAGEDRQAIAVELVENFLRETTAGEPELGFTLPGSGSVAVAGYPLYFQGTVQNPLENSVTVGLLVDECNTWAAEQSFSVEGGDWNGMIILPETTLEELACAVAYTGSYGEGDWREIQLLLPVVSPEDPAAPRILLENPYNLIFAAGAPAELAGAAVDAPEVEVTITDPGNGSLLAQGTAPTGDFGLWEISLPIPEESPDLVSVQITLVEEEVDEPYSLTTSALISRG